MITPDKAWIYKVLYYIDPSDTLGLFKYNAKFED